MPNLIDKLNLLVRSSLNSVLSDTPYHTDESQLPKVPAARLGKDIDKEIAELRRRIDAALAEEDAMQGRLDQLQQQIAAYDQQADDALQRGDEPNARYLVQQMQRQQNLAGMMQAELEQHRRSTSDFIQRVNTLEAIVADARREQQSQPPTPVPEAQTDQAPGVNLSNLLREARERVESALSTGDPAHHIPITIEPSEAAAPAAAPQNIPVATNDTPNDAQVEDDLTKRRSRLSKPDTPPAPDTKPDNKPG